MSWFFASCGQSIGASFSALVLSSNYSVLIFFSINWFGLLSVQGTRESSPALQFESISSSGLSLFIVQLLHPYGTTGKTIAFNWLHLKLQAFNWPEFRNNYETDSASVIVVWVRRQFPGASYSAIFLESSSSSLFKDCPQGLRRQHLIQFEQSAILFSFFSFFSFSLILYPSLSSNSVGLFFFFF